MQLFHRPDTRPPAAVAAPVLPPPPAPGRSAAAGLLWESTYAAAPAGAQRAPQPPDTGGFMAGTRVRTASGESLVEALRIGDTVLTRSGLRRQVKWIGRRAYAADTVTGNPNLRPVLLLAGALGHGIPNAPLRLAPMHRLLIDDAVAGSVLVAAAALVNGLSILRDPVGDPVAYFHIELNSHDVLLAEGAAVETFADAGNRAIFANSAEFAALYPRQAGGLARPCMKLLDQGPELWNIRRRLAGHAAAGTAAPIFSHLRFEIERHRGILEGWALDDAAPDTPVELDVLLDGQHHTRLIANKYRPDLDRAGFAGGRCGFTCPLPGRGGHIAIRRAAPTHAAVAA